VGKDKLKISIQPIILGENECLQTKPCTQYRKSAKVWLSAEMTQ